MKSSLLFIYNTTVYYGGDLILPIIILFILFFSWSLLIFYRLYKIKTKIRLLSTDKISGKKEIPGYDLESSIKKFAFEKFSRQIDILLWFICLFPVLGLSGTLLGVSKISVESVSNSFSHQVLRLGIMESITTTVSCFLIFIISFLIYKTLVKEFNFIIDRVNILSA